MIHELLYTIEIHLYSLQIHLFRWQQTAKTKRLYHFRLLWELLATVKNSTCSQCAYLLQNAHRKTRLEAVGVYLHFKVLKCFAVSVQQFHSTHTPQNPLRYPKSFDPPLRTKPNYSLPKLTLKICSKIQQNKLSPHYLSTTLSNCPTSPNP